MGARACVLYARRWRQRTSFTGAAAAASFCEIGRETVACVCARDVRRPEAPIYLPIANDSRTGGVLGQGERFPGRCWRRVTCKTRTNLTYNTRYYVPVSYLSSTSSGSSYIPTDEPIIVSENEGFF